MSYKLSVMICNYNDAWCIETALNSIPKRNDIQIVIVDDGSIDKSDEVIRNYIKNNSIFGYKYIKNGANIGLGLSRKIAQNFIEGEYFTVLDCDDYFYPDKLNSIIDNYLDKNFDIVYFNVDRVSARTIIPNKINYKGYSGHNKIFKTQYITNNNIEWHNLRRGSDLDFDRQWWWRTPNIGFTNITAKKWNRPNERMTNLSLYGAKDMSELSKKSKEFLNSKTINTEILRNILRHRNHNDFLENYNPEFEKAEYNYEVII